MKTYIDELKDVVRFSSGGPVSISLETAKRLLAFYQEAQDYDVLIGCDIVGRLNDLNDTLPEVGE